MSEDVFEPAGEQIRLLTKGHHLQPEPTLQQRLELFDQATARQAARQATTVTDSAPSDRGWSREELYQRSLPG